MPEPTRAARPRIRFTAEDWVGGYYRGDSLAYGRPWVAVYGAASAYPRAALGFTLDSPPAGPAVFTVEGLDDEWAELNPIALDVNGQRVFSGPSPFVNWDGVGDGANAAWTSVPFTIPDGVLRAGTNEIAMLNLSPAASFNAPPYILVADAVLETGGRSGGRPPEEAAQETVVAQETSSTLTFTAEDWAGGYYQGSGLFYGRPWVAVYGAASAYPGATIRFRISGPVTEPATFTLTGLDDELAGQNPVSVEINGQVLFSGPSPFANWDGVGTGANAAWTQATFTIPPEMLREGRNEIAVANLSPSGNFNAPPYVLLSDATLDVPGAELNRRGRDTPR